MSYSLNFEEAANIPDRVVRSGGPDNPQGSDAKDVAGFIGGMTFAFCTLGLQNVPASLVCGTIGVGMGRMAYDHWPFHKS